MLLAQVALGSGAIFARYGLEAGLSPRSLTFWRMALAFAMVSAILRPATGPGAPLSPSLRVTARLCVAGVALAIHFWTWFGSLELIPVARSTLLVSTTPVWTALLLWALTRRPPAVRFWGGLALGMFGAWLVTGGSHMGVSGPGAGDLLAVAGAIAFGAYLLLTAELQSQLGTRRVVAWTYGSAALTFLGVILMCGSDGAFWPGNARAWFAVLGLAAAPQLLGHTLLNWSLRHYSASTVAAATLVEPVVAGSFAWVLFGETIAAYQAAGALILILGVAVVLSGRDAASRLAI